MTRLQWPKAILLDLDDTILAFDSVSDASWMVVLHRHSDRFATVGVQTTFQAIKLSARKFWRDPERHRIGRLDLTAARETIIGNALWHQGFQDDGLVRLMADEYDITRTQAIHPIPGAIETIHEMCKAGVKLALITNGQTKSQREKIERFELADFFDGIFIEGECGFGKPDERVYLEALSILNVRPEDAWMVGDNWEWEVAAPQQLGIRGIWVNSNERTIPGDGTIQPFLMVKSLAELGHTAHESR